MSQETRTETRTKYASEHEARIAVTNALLKPNITRVWWAFHEWEKGPTAKPYEVLVETVLKEPTLPDFDTMLRDDGPRYETVPARTWDSESSPDEPISRS